LPNNSGTIALTSDIPAPIINPVTGTGANGQVAFWNGASSQTGDNGLFWDNTNKRLQIFNPSEGNSIAPLIVRNTIPYQSPFTQFIQFWQVGSGSNVMSLRADGNLDTIGNIRGNTLRLNGIGTNTTNFNMLARNGQDGTGINFLSGHVIGFTTNSLERMRILSTGDVGIGTTSPGARLDVRAQGALSTDIAFRVRNSADTANLVDIRGNGNVGIGATSDAGFKLDVNGSARVSGRFTVSSGQYFTVSTGVANGLFSSGVNDLQIFNRNIAIANIFSSGNESSFGIHIAYGVTNTLPNSSALLDLTSTIKGFLPPRMTNAQRLAIASPAVGLMVYCTDVLEGLYINKSTGWTFII
jgi:hypothetical protein